MVKLLRPSRSNWSSVSSEAKRPSLFTLFADPLVLGVVVDGGLVWTAARDVANAIVRLNRTRNAFEKSLPSPIARRRVQVQM